MTVPPDVVFSSLAFASTGSAASTSPTLLTLPARLSNSIVNVKDWGAKGDGVTDDSGAIAAAINYAYNSVGLNVNAYSATVYFPPGTYRCNSQISLYGTIVGAGRDVTILRGNYSAGTNPPFHQSPAVGGSGGEVMDSPIYLCIQNTNNLDLLADLTIWNESTAVGSGAFFSQGNPGQNNKFVNVRFKGYGCGACMSMEQYGAGVYNCIAECTVPISRADSASPRPSTATGFAGVASDVTGSVGFYVPQGVLIGCTAMNFDVGYALAGVGQSLISCRAYRCAWGYWVGLKPCANSIHPNLAGSVLLSNIVERCSGALKLDQISGLFAGANVLNWGTSGPLDPAPIAGMSFSGGTITVTTAAAHNISVGARLSLAVSPANWMPNVNGYITVTAITTTSPYTFSYTASDPGSPAFSSGTWNYTTGWEVYSNQNSMSFLAANTDVVPGNAAVNYYIEDAQATQVVWMATRGQGGWRLPAGDQYYSGGHKFVMCGKGAASPPVPYVKFAGLPAANSYTAPNGPFDGDEYTIIDGQCYSAGSPVAPAFGLQVTGGGPGGAYTSHLKIRYDSNLAYWRCVGF